jgi:hypothetical protein
VTFQTEDVRFLNIALNPNDNSGKRDYVDRVLLRNKASWEAFNSGTAGGDPAEFFPFVKEEKCESEKRSMLEVFRAQFESIKVIGSSERPLKESGKIHFRRVKQFWLNIWTNIKDDNTCLVEKGKERIQEFINDWKKDLDKTASTKADIASFDLEFAQDYITAYRNARKGDDESSKREWKRIRDDLVKQMKQYFELTKKQERQDEDSDSEEEDPEDADVGEDEFENELTGDLENTEDYKTRITKWDKPRPLLLSNDPSFKPNYNENEEKPLAKYAEAEADADEEAEAGADA